MQRFAINGRELGDGCPVYVICEIGINHEGDFALARRMIEAAGNCGADSVKFQWERPEAKVAAWDEEYVELAGWLFTRDQMAELFGLAAARGLACSAVVADSADMAFIRGLGADYFKIESDDITHLDLVRAVGESGAALMLSTGVATLEQVDAAARAFLETGNPRLVLLHTVSAYPTSDAMAQLAVMDTYRAAFGRMVGYCDHTEDVLASLVAAARGAAVIEKHFTLDRSAHGSDWEVSLEPAAFAALVRNIRRVEVMAGPGRKEIFPPEAGKDRRIRRSIVAARDIAAGEVLDRAALVLKKPGAGLGPELLPLFLGKPARRAIPRDTLLAPDMV